MNQALKTLAWSVANEWERQHGWSSDDGAAQARKQVEDIITMIENRGYKIVRVQVGDMFTVEGQQKSVTACPHCQRDDLHQHIIDRKGFLHK